MDDAVHYGLKNYVGVTHSEIGNAYLDNAYNGLDTYLTDGTRIFHTTDTGASWSYYKCNNGWEASKTNNGCGNANTHVYAHVCAHVYLHVYVHVYAFADANVNVTVVRFWQYS